MTEARRTALSLILGVLLFGALLWFARDTRTPEQIAADNLAAEKEQFAIAKEECKDLSHTYHLYGNLNSCAKIRMKEQDEAEPDDSIPNDCEHSI